MVFFCCGCLFSRRKRRTRRHHLFSSSSITSGAQQQDEVEQQQEQQPPTYRSVNRAECPLLNSCWAQNWEYVVVRIQSYPDECRSYKTKTGGRTALHLATMPGANCPEHVLKLLLKSNPHAVIVHDRHQHGGTPLHFLCGSKHRTNYQLVKLFVDTAKEQQHKYGLNSIIRIDCHSPLYIACRKAAPPATLHVLVSSFWSQQLRPSSSADGAGITGRWIAPWTGGESCEFIQQQQQHQHYTCGEYLSPLLGLWEIVKSNFFCSTSADGCGSPSPSLLLNENDISVMREVAITILGRIGPAGDGGENSGGSTVADDTVLVLEFLNRNYVVVSSNTNDDDNDHATEAETAKSSKVINSWMQCLVLLRPFTQSASHLVMTVSSLYTAIPDLLALVCEVFPEQVYRKCQRCNYYDPINTLEPPRTTTATVSSQKVSVRAVETNQINPLQAILMYQQRRHEAIQNLVKVLLLNAQKYNNIECLLEDVDTTTGLYMCFFAATYDAPLEIIFSLLTLSPQVLQMQGGTQHRHNKGEQSTAAIFVASKS